MTTVVYNGVVLRDCETLSFEQDVQYDPSNTDVLFSRFKIRVASTMVARINDAGIDSFGIDTANGTTVIQRAHDIQGKLSESRGDFWMLVDNCVQDEKQGTEFEPSLDQPLLIACGRAWDEDIVVGSDENGNPIKYIERTPLTMFPHPFSSNSSTPAYGSIAFNKSNVLDCENGPKPRKVSVQKIIGGRALRVEFEIEICRNICSADFDDINPALLGSQIDQTPNILSNRWSLEESKDANWITTRSINGTLRVANRDYWPHAMRLLCVPNLMAGYKRVRQSFVSDPTDLVLKYRIEDQQAHAAPPYPAISWSGHHAETASGPNAMIKGGEFHIRLRGVPGVDKQQLIGAAGKIAVNRLRGLVANKDANGKRTYKTLLKNASIIDILNEPVIEMRVQVQYVDASFKALALRVTKMGRPIGTLEEPDPDDPYLIDGYSPQSFPVPIPYGSPTPAGIFSCYLQKPCSIWHDMPNGIPVGDGDQVPTPIDKENTTSEKPEYPKQQSIEPHVLPPDSDETPTEDNDLYDFPYSFIELQNRYLIDNGWISMPVATTDPDAKTATLIKMHGRTASRVLTLTVTRDGKPPVIPSMVEDQVDHNGHREVLARMEVIAKAPKLMANGESRQHEVFVEYVYLMEKAPGPTDKLRGGSSPLDLFSPDSNLLDLGEIVDQNGHYQWESGITQTYPAAPGS